MAWIILQQKLRKKDTFFIAKPLEDIVNSMMLEGVFLDVLNHDKIVPVHKRPDKEIINNYLDFNMTFDALIIRYFTIS